MSALRLAHVSIRSRDLRASQAFYCGLLGLREGYRPPFPFPGLWLYDESDQAVIHLIGDGSGADDYLGARAIGSGGAFDHLALAAYDWPRMKARLDRAGIAYQTRIVPDLEQLQVFTRDPSGLVVELAFAEPRRKTT